MSNKGEILTEEYVLDLLKEKIQEAHAQGLSNEEIKKILLKAGWRDYHILPLIYELDQEKAPTVSKKLPSTAEIRREVRRLRRNFQQTLPHKELKHRRLVVAWITLNILLLLLLLLSESFWASFNINGETDIQGYFVLDSCQTSGKSKCDFQIIGDTATFKLDSNYRLVSMNFPLCKTIELGLDNIAHLSDCSFSSVSNKADFYVAYEHPDSKLVHKERIRIANLFEFTTLRYATRSSFNRITGTMSTDNEE